MIYKKGEKNHLYRNIFIFPLVEIFAIFPLMSMYADGNAMVFTGLKKLQFIIFFTLKPPFPSTENKMNLALTENLKQL